MAIKFHSIEWAGDLGDRHTAFAHFSPLSVRPTPRPPPPGQSLYPCCIAFAARASLVFADGFAFQAVASRANRFKQIGQNPNPVNYPLTHCSFYHSIS
jgi:hypothetical protein